MKKIYVSHFLLILALAVLLVSGCGGGAGGGTASSPAPAQVQSPSSAPEPEAPDNRPEPETTPTPEPEPTPTPETMSWDDVNDFLYQLQEADLTVIGNTKFDLIVMDYSADGCEDTRYTAEQIAALKNSPGGEKLVLAYMSIGEAEDYRWYWNSRWDANGDGIPDSGAPSWLGTMNPDWGGNYKVKYWNPDWQAVIFGTPSSYLDKIIDAGFDGVYLDIVDAYEYWGPEGASGMNRASAAQDMINFVTAIANYARITKGKANFGIFPQNAEGLSSDLNYVQIVTGMGKEDLWYNDNKKQANDYTNEAIDCLDTFKRAGKLILVIDYVTEQNLIDDFYSKAQAKDYIPYATVRMLDKITINAGHEPD
ncbi:MAG: MJ1477/TM1410 family putative glycoside hydrolase [Armatimonadota bacterium]